MTLPSNIRPGTRPPGGNLRGFTLIELIVVIGILAVLMALGHPVLTSVRSKARELVNTSNQRQICMAVNLFAADNCDRYPPSIAKVGFGDGWNWADPTKLAGSDLRTPGLHRSVSAYLRSYLPKATTIYCPRAPSTCSYLQDAWDSGDLWDNPQTPVSPDVVGGTYCLYWNYVGLLGPGLGLFIGPAGPADGRNRGPLLVTDYLGYNPWRTPQMLASCEPFRKAQVVSETALLAAYWYGPQGPNDLPPVAIRAGYRDGHVQVHDASELITLRVIKVREPLQPYSDDEPGPGLFYLPRTAVPAR